MKAAGSTIRGHVSMEAGLPICVMEPNSRTRAYSTVGKLVGRLLETPVILQPTTIDEIKQRLKRVREYYRDNMDVLVEQLRRNLAEKCPGVRVKSAIDSLEAVEYIVENSEGINIVSTNNSRVVDQELKPGLASRGYTVINSYLDEFDVEGKETRDFTEVPVLSDKGMACAPSLTLLGDVT